MKLAIIIGHTWRSPGAYSAALGRSEYPFNEVVAGYVLAAALDAGRGNDVAIFRRDGGGIPAAYAAAKAWGMRDGEKFATIEIHFNSAGDPSAQGTETLYVSEISRPLAESVQREMVSFLKLKDRGAKHPWQGRGEASLTAIPGVPQILVEPFFGSSNPDRGPDLVDDADEQRALAKAILRGALNVLS